MLILIALAALGTDTGLARYLLRFEATGRQGDIDRIVRVALTPVVATSLALMVIVLAAAEPIADAIGLDVDGGATMLRVVAVALPFASINDFALAGTRAFGKMRPTVVIDRLGRSLLQTVALLLVGLAGGGPVALMVAWTAPYVLAGIVSAVTFSRLLEFRRREWSPDAETSDPTIVRREFWAYTWPRSIARICQIVIQRADIVIIAALLGAKEAAIYTAATRFVVLGQFAVTAIVQVLQPRFTDLLAREELATVREVFKVSTAWSMALAWPLYLGVAGAAPLYLGLFGESYGSDGVTTVVVMALAMMFASAAGPLDTLLLMAGGSTASLVNAGVATIIDVTMCFLLIPHVGMSGAAIAWAAAVVSRNALTWVQVEHILHFSPLSRGGAIVALSSVLCIGAPVVIVAIATGTEPVPVVLAWCIGAGAYLAVLWSQRRPLGLDALRTVVRRPARAAAAG